MIVLEAGSGYKSQFLNTCIHLCMCFLSYVTKIVTREDETVLAFERGVGGTPREAVARPGTSQIKKTWRAGSYLGVHFYQRHLLLQR